MNIRQAKKISRRPTRIYRISSFNKSVDIMNRWRRKHGIPLWMGHVERIGRMPERVDMPVLCACGSCCGCKGIHGNGECPHPRCAITVPFNLPNNAELTLFATDPMKACAVLRGRIGVGLMDAKRMLEREGRLLDNR